MDTRQSSISDEHLLEGITAHNRSYFQIFFERYHPVLVIYGLSIYPDRALVDDMIQEVFINIWQKRASATNIVSPKSYLKKILARKIIKKRQLVIKQEKAKTNPHTPLQLPSYESMLIQQQQNEETRIKLEKALSELTTKQKVIIQQRFFEGLSYDEIAEKNQTQKRTIYNQVHTAINILKKYMLVHVLLFL